MVIIIVRVSVYMPIELNEHWSWPGTANEPLIAANHLVRVDFDLKFNRLLHHFVNFIFYWFSGEHKMIAGLKIGL